MLKGHVFSRQIFGNPIFALFINTFLNGRNGVSDNYKNGMKVTYSGTNITVDSGAVCIQGRFLEEDTSTTIAAGTDTAYCKLVIEIDLDKQNTESEFTQGAYKIIKSTSNYPELTQTDIVKNNAGIYQYELARFRTGTNGISDLQDMRTFLNFDSIYDAIEKEYRKILENLQKELENVENGSAYLLKTKKVDIEGTDLNDYKEDGIYYFDMAVTPVNIPAGYNGWLHVIKGDDTFVKQIWYRLGTTNENDYQAFVRTYNYREGGWSNWTKYLVGTINVTKANTDLNSYTTDGTYFFANSSVTPTNIPTGTNGWLVVMTGTDFVKQIWYRAGTMNSNDYETYVRTWRSDFLGNNGWSDWTKYITTKDFTELEVKVNSLDIRLASVERKNK